MVLALVAFGCNVDPFTLSSDGGGVTDGDGGMNGGGDGGMNGDGDGGGGTPDAAPPPDACVPAPESCNEEDDDCDGEIDEDFDLDSDPGNCGSCGNSCSEPGAAGSCEGGSCSFSCLSNFHDLNDDLGTTGGDGCEYGPCTVSGDEVCNIIDDDCDGKTDENIQGLDSDPMNCGSCFNQCIFVNVENATCTDGECGFDACLDEDGDDEPDYADVTNPPAGCEYECPVSPPLDQELCNAVDDDCDGVIDELPIDGLGDPCYESSDGGCVDDGNGAFTCNGICDTGVVACNFGVEVCEGESNAASDEICDDLDHDCDGNPRNGFDTNIDPNNCGTSCQVCDLPNVVPVCEAGQCVIDESLPNDGCVAGFADGDGDPSNGCEYECTKTGPFEQDGVQVEELCDGKDNDCDTVIDENVVPPDSLDCTIAGTLCDQVQPTCSECGSVTSWRCDYSGVEDVQTDACGSLVPETLCDEIDNDCDTATDESFPNKETECDDNELGTCRDIGEFVCSDDGTQVVCDVTDDNPAPGPDEVCNNEDDDCDGTVDEDAPNVTVGIDEPPGDGVIDYYIFAYEASRPDADASSVGSASHRACSEEGRIPWHTVTWVEADAACDAAFGTIGDGVGRLCSASEWELACGGDGSLRYPYGDTYDGGACNGHDYDHCTPGDHSDDEQVVPTGHDYECPGDGVPNTCQLQEVGLDALDMSGNLKEWTATESSTGFFEVRGGSYNNVAPALTCDNDFLSFSGDTAFPNLGFRCCVDGP